MGTAPSIGQAGIPAAPELPSISIAALAVGLSDLLRAADGLGLPHMAIIHESTRHYSLQFAPEHASLKALARWAHRFGGVLVSENRLNANHQACTYAGVSFDYSGVEVGAYAYVPIT
jgi:hypothetical protein